MSTDASIGDRLARLRAFRDLTQEELAERAGVHVDTIRKLEQGVRRSARMTTYERLATALDIELGRLLGQATVTQHLPDGGGILALRSAVQDLSGLPGLPVDDSDEDAPAVSDLRATFAAAQAGYQRGKFTDLTTMLPGLLTDLRAAARDAAGTSYAEEVWGMSAETYIVAADLAAQLGQTDLAYMAVERALAAAQRASDPMREALAVSTLSLVLLRQGRWDQASAVSARKAREIEPKFSTTNREQLAMYGLLLLSAAVPASRGKRGAEAREYLTQAKAAATLSGTLRVLGTAFGPSAVAMQATTVAVSLGEASEAMERSRDVRLGDLPWAISRTRHRLDVAHALSQLGRHEEAFTELMEIEAAQPEWMKHQVLAATTVRELLAEEQRRNAPLRSLAGRLGIDPAL